MLIVTILGLSFASCLPSGHVNVNSTEQINYEYVYFKNVDAKEKIWKMMLKMKLKMKLDEDEVEDEAEDEVEDEDEDEVEVEKPSQVNF